MMNTPENKIYLIPVSSIYDYKNIIAQIMVNYYYLKDIELNYIEWIESSKRQSSKYFIFVKEEEKIIYARHSSSNTYKDKTLKISDIDEFFNDWGCQCRII